MLTTWNFRDSRQRRTRRTIWNTQTTLALVAAEVATLSAAWNPLTDLQLVSVLISQEDEASAFAGNPPSNIDSGVSVQLLGGDGRLYDFDLPDVPDALTVSEAMPTDGTEITAFFALFGAGGTWRLNISNPTEVTAIVKATLDK